MRTLVGLASFTAYCEHDSQHGAPCARAEVATGCSPQVAGPDGAGRQQDESVQAAQGVWGSCPALPFGDTFDICLRHRSGCRRSTTLP